VTDELKQRILEIPGEEGWIKGDECAMRIAGEMLARGVDEDSVVEWIEAIYWEAAGHFGA